MRFKRGRITRVLLAAICLLVMTGPAAATVSYDHIYLADFSVSVAWNTSMSGRYALGVSNDPGGSLIPLSLGKLNPLLAVGDVYYLYAGNLASGLFTPGHVVQVQIYSNYIGLGGASPFNYATFNVVGTPGVFQLWNHTSSIDTLPPTDIYLGWAQGTADKVTTNSFSPGEGNDYYLVLGIGREPTPPSGVPEPSTLLLLGSGLLGLVEYGRRRMKK